MSIEKNKVDDTYKKFNDGRFRLCQELRTTVFYFTVIIELVDIVFHGEFTDVILNVKLCEPTTALAHFTSYRYPVTIGFPTEVVEDT